jgi:hypothetical protein
MEDLSFGSIPKRRPSPLEKDKRMRPESGSRNQLDVITKIITINQIQNEDH